MMALYHNNGPACCDFSRRSIFFVFYAGDSDVTFVVLKQSFFCNVDTYITKNTKFTSLQASVTFFIVTSDAIMYTITYCVYVVFTIRRLDGCHGKQTPLISLCVLYSMDPTQREKNRELPKAQNIFVMRVLTGN